MKIQLFRLSLLARTQIRLPLFGGISDVEQTPMTRGEYLQSVLAKKWPIDRYNARVTYYPGTVDDNLLVGHFARQRKEVRHDGPETGFSPMDIEYWEKATLLINLDSDQQVVGVEFNSDVGSPKGLLQELIMKINAEDHGPYKIDAFPLHNEQNFHQAVNNYPHPITFIEFTYVVPNVFGGAGEVKKALDDFKKGMKARTVKASFSNPEGLDTTDETVTESVEYVAKGGGEVKAKSGNQVVYDSQKKGEAITASVPPEEVEAIKKGFSPSAFLKSILRR